MIILKEKKYSKVFLPDGAVDIEDLNDKQLENVAKYNHLTKERKKNIIKNSAKVIATNALIPATIDALILQRRSKGYDQGTDLIRAGKVALIGGAVGTGLSIGGHLHHKHNAKDAEKEIEKRKLKNK